MCEIIFIVKPPLTRVTSEISARECNYPNYKRSSEGRHMETSELLVREELGIWIRLEICVALTMSVALV